MEYLNSVYIITLLAIVVVFNIRLGGGFYRRISMILGLYLFIALCWMILDISEGISGLIGWVCWFFLIYRIVFRNYLLEDKVKSSRSLLKIAIMQFILVMISLTVITELEYSNLISRMEGPVQYKTFGLISCGYVISSWLMYKVYYRKRKLTYLKPMSDIAYLSGLIAIPIVYLILWVLFLIWKAL